jgi:D-amino peptidase
LATLGIAAPCAISSKESTAKGQPGADDRVPHAGDGVKIYMHWDMEGASGIFTREHVWYWEKGVRKEIAAEGRQLVTADAKSACAAALKAGAEKLIVCDTHHGGGNLELDKMPSDSRITCHGRSVGREDGKRRWMPGLDQTVDGLMLLGHHAKAGTENAFLPHTWMGDWADFRINGQSVGEIGIEACYAGHWDVPLVLVQGGEAACAEARRQFPGVVTATVKRATTRDLCTGLDADSARRETARRVAEAVEKARAGSLSPYKPTLPMTVTIRMKTAEAADKAALRPGVRRLDDHTVEGRVDRQCDVVKWIVGAGLDMTP